MLKRLLAVWFLVFSSTATNSADLHISGAMGVAPASLNLRNFDKKEGQYEISANFCDNSEDSAGSMGSWVRSGNDILLTDRQDDVSRPAGRLSFSETEEKGTKLYIWTSESLLLGKQARTFEGKSTQASGYGARFHSFCDRGMFEPGSVVFFAVPTKLQEAGRLARSLSIRGKVSRDALVADSSVKNVFKIDVPPGTDNNLITKLKADPLVLDATREVLPLDPGISFVWLPKKSLLSDNYTTDTLREKITEILNKAWPNTANKIEVISKRGTVFELRFFGPASSFVAINGLGGYWLDAKIELIADDVRSSDRMIANLKQAKAMAWGPERKGKPPSGYGHILECDGSGVTRDMKAPIEVITKLLTAASSIYGGADIDVSGC